MSLEILFLYIYFSTIWFIVESQTNVASLGVVKSCDGTSLPRINDGIRNITLAERMYGDCKETSFISMSFEGYEYKIHYVVVYEGESINEINHQMDYFHVITTNMNENREWCGQFPTPSVEPLQDKGMRVNCISSTDFKTSSILIHFPRNKGFNIAEVEAYSFAEDGQTLIHRGCLESFEIDNKYYTTKMTDLKSCAATCTSFDYTFMAVNRRTCNCINDYDKHKELPADSCSAKCSNSDETCDSYSLYVVTIHLPLFVSCPMFEDAFENSINIETIASCLHKCQNNKYAFLKEGTFCRCDDFVDKSMESFPEKCNSPCSGDSNSFCGGVDSVSIYKTCSGNEVTPCSLLFRCHGDWDHYGVCSYCEEGFIGKHCIERVIESPPANKSTTPMKKLCPLICYTRPNTECKLYKEKYVCDCKEGFKRKKDTLLCIDIDECIYGPCDPKYSTCKNVDGGHECDCKDNFDSIKYADDICKTNDTLSSVDEPYVFLTMIISGLAIFILITLITYFCRRTSEESDSVATNLRNSATK